MVTPDTSFMKRVERENIPRGEVHFNGIPLFELLVWPHEVETWFHSWYRGRVETLDAKYNLILGSSL